MQLFTLGKGSFWGAVRRLPCQPLRITKLILLLLTVLFFQSNANGYSQVVSFSGKNVPLSSVFSSFEKQTGYSFFFNYEVVKNTKPVSLDIYQQPLENALTKLLDGEGLSFYIKNRTVFIVGRKDADMTKDATEGPGLDVKGRVLNERGVPLSGATIQIKGTAKGTATNTDGQFELKGLKEGQILTISYTGYTSQEAAVHSGENLTFTLTPSKSELDKVQVIAYGQTTQRLNVSNITTISADDISKQPVNNPLLALEGRVPGLVIAQSSGLPGAAIAVHIQGQNSINSGNDPFYVIDGVPYQSSLLTNLNTVLGGGNPLSYINPNDIESISILKDADATAIYGSRAANGAILITTKKAKPGAAKVNLNIQQGWGIVTRKLDMLNTPQYLEMRREGLKNDGASPGFYDYDVNGFWDTTRYTDWQKYFIGNTAQYSNFNASVSGGTAQLQYTLSGTYHRETTVFPGQTSNQSGSLHFAANSVSANGKFHTQFTANYMYDYNRLPGVDMTNDALNLPPDAPKLYNPDGSFNWDLDANGNTSFYNTMAMDGAYVYRNKTNNLISNLVLGYKILPQLEIKSSFGYTNMQTNDNQYQTEASIVPDQRSFILRNAAYGTSSALNWLIEPQIEYRGYAGPGKIDALIGSTIQQNSGTASSVSGAGYTSDALLPAVTAAATVTPLYSTASIYKYNALFSRVNYNLYDKYLIDLIVRRDGSSRFGSANRFADFWSAGAGWVFTEERFLKYSQQLLSFGKIKASYGTTGNDQIGDYRYLSLYNPLVLSNPYQSIPASSTSILPNPYLEWEKTNKLNIGLDLAFWKDRILFNINYYRNRSSNELIGYNLPSITGAGGVTENFPATVQNSGWEIQIASNNIKSKNFTWRTTLNLTPSPVNKLIAFPDLATSSVAGLYAIGKPITSSKFFHYIGVDPATGLYLVADSKGNPTTTPDYTKDKTVWLNTAASLYGGIENFFQYKSISLSFLFTLTRQNLNNYSLGRGAPPGSGFSNQTTYVLNRWREPGDKALLQKFDAYYMFSATYGNATASDHMFSKCTYVRLKNLSLSWELPAEWQTKWHLENTRLFMNAQNLLLFTSFKGLDPESGFSSLPPLRVITLGLQVGL